MRVHQVLVIKIVDIDPLFEPFMLLVVLDYVFQENVNVLFAVLVVADEDLGHDLERVLGRQNLVTYFVF